MHSELVKTVLATLIISFALATPARAELNVDINLTVAPGFLDPQSQWDSRWGAFPIGPRNTVVPGLHIDFARCGCNITSLSTAIEALNGGGLPWFSHDQFTAGGFTTPILSFSPKYLDDYFNVGPAPLLPRAPGWGYGAGGGTDCGVQIWPWAASGSIDPVLFPGTSDPLTPTGLTWDTLALTQNARQQIDNGLLQGYPTIVAIKVAGGFHANLIVGWNNTEKIYLIFDPMWNPARGAQLMGTDWPQGATNRERYVQYLRAIDEVYPLRPVLTGSRWLIIKDDPEPIELRLTDPRGRRTGHDPLTNVNIQENMTAFYSEFTSWADPLGVIPEAASVRYIAARDPEPGVYGLEVFGTGNGPFTLTLGTVNGDQQQDVATLTGNITSGEIKRYEITYSGPGAVMAAAVPAFVPRAEAGNAIAAYVGNTVAFDGRGSQQIAGAISAYSWNFGDGTSATGAQQTHAYTAAGIYTATLTVTNADGLTATDTRIVTVVVFGSQTLKETIRVSVTDTGLQANDVSWYGPQVTPDGLYVTFFSRARNLVAADTNGVDDIFVKDLSTGTVERANVSTAGVQANAFANVPSISADGRFVAFYSGATNLVIGFNGGLYVHDRLTGTTEGVVQSTDGGDSRVSLSGDGRYIAFRNGAPLLPAASNNAVYVRDRQLGTLEVVSAYDGRDPRLSADGRFVAFSASFGPDAFGGIAGVYLRDRQTGSTELVSLSASGAEILGFNPSISSDGRLISFAVATNTFPSKRNVFLRDRVLGTTEQINIGSGVTDVAFSPSMDASGRYVTFVSASNAQAYLRDREAGTTEMVSVATDGTPPSFGGLQSFGVFDSSRFAPSVASDGAVVFTSNAPNLVAGDSNDVDDIFMRRPIPGSGGGPATPPLANLGGPYVGWASSAAVPAAIRLDGGGSIDPGNRTLTAHWDFGDGSPVTTAPLVTTHAYAQVGLYQVTLTVSAGGVTSAPAHTEVEVLPALPSAGLSIGACVAPGGTLSLDGAAPAANGTLVANGWDTTTGPIQLAPVTITLPWGQIQLPTMLPGLTFQGTVAVPSATTDGHYNAAVISGSTAPFSIPCARSANLRPLAVAGGPIYRAQAGVPLMLDGSSSSDPENAPLSYRWDFGDTTSGSTVTPTHTYAGEGSYFVTLIVNDGVQDSATMIGTRSFAMVVVTAKLQTVPRVTYDGNGSTGGSVPADGNPYVAGATVTVLGNTGSLVKTGYTFAGWNTAANGSGTSYAGGATFAMGSGDVTLYAKWTLTVTSYATPSIPTLSESAMMALMLLLGLAGAYRIRGT